MRDLVHTAEPWAWHGTEAFGLVLMSQKKMFLVMDFVQAPDGKSQPRFADRTNKRTPKGKGGTMQTVNALGGIDKIPDALTMAAAPTLLLELEKANDIILRLWSMLQLLGVPDDDPQWPNLRDDERRAAIESAKLPPIFVE